jgi:hypothetical protein
MAYNIVDKFSRFDRVRFHEIFLIRLIFYLIISQMNTICTHKIDDLEPYYALNYDES